MNTNIKDTDKKYLDLLYTMSNPFINTQSNTETNIKVNNITQNAFGNIIVPVSSCPDVQIADPTNGQQLMYSTALNQ